MIRWLFVALACLLSLVAGAGPLALPAAPDAGLAPRPGAVLPLDLRLRDDLGQPVRLRDYFRPGQPVLLVPGYYHCTQLCGLLMQQLLQGLQESGLPRRDWRIVAVSIDPADTPADARQRRELYLAYAGFLEGAHADPAALHLDLLLADADQVRRIADAMGYRFQALSATADKMDGQRFAHPATVVVVTPAGRVSAYLNGLQFEPDDLRLAVVEASEGRPGSLGNRIALLCAHFDPALGRLDGDVMGIVRGVGLLTLAALLLAAWRHARRTGP